MFATLPRRSIVTDHQSKRMTSAFVEELFCHVPFLSPSSIARCVRLHCNAEPSFWTPDAADVGNRLAALDGLAKSLPRKKALFVTCTVMFYVETRLNLEETWCNRLVLLLCGLGWLRTALIFEDDIIRFDGSEMANEGFRDKIRDHTKIFNLYDWDDNYGSYYRRGFQSNASFAALALASLLKNIVIVRDQYSELLHLCREADAQCSVLHFLLDPSMKRLGDIAVAQKSLEMEGNELPSHLLPKSTVDFILSEQWGVKGDFAWNNKIILHQHLRGIPFLLSQTCIACQHMKVTEAVCRYVKLNSEVFWKHFSNRDIPSYDETDFGLISREILQSCLLIFRLGVDEVGLSQDFVNFFLHLMLSFNWFGTCDCCTPTSPMATKNSNLFVVSIGNVEALHEAEDSQDLQRGFDSVLKHYTVLACEFVRSRRTIFSSNQTNTILLPEA